jgi:chromatin-remodeling ATPase INO80
VQDIVVGNKNFTDVTKPSEIVQLLLNDDQLARLDSSATTDLSSKRAGKRPAVVASDADGQPVRDLWNEEGDDFFGHVGNTGSNHITTENLEDETGTPGPGIARGKKRKATTAPRGRKVAPKAAAGKRHLKSGTTTGNATPVGSWTLLGQGLA